MKISDLKKIKMSRLSIIKTFNFFEIRDDIIKNMLTKYEEFLNKLSPKINWIGELMGESDEGDKREDLYQANREFNGIKISISIPYIKSYYEPEIYNSYEEMAEEHEIDDEVKQLKPKSYTTENGDDEVWRDEYGRWIYREISNDHDYKWYYIKINAEYPNAYFLIDDTPYKTLYDAHKYAMDQINKIKEDAFNNELSQYLYDENEFNEKLKKSAEEAGLAVVYDPEYDKQQNFNFDESISALKGIL